MDSRARRTARVALMVALAALPIGCEGIIGANFDDGRLRGDAAPTADAGGAPRRDGGDGRASLAAIEASKDTELSAGRGHTCMLVTAGARCWGTISGPLSPTPRLAIAAGGSEACGLFESGDVRCWGGAPAGRSIVGLDAPSASIHVGWGHACAVLSTGAVRCWGGNNLGQLGTGDRSDSDAAVQVRGLTGVGAVAVGGEHTCALSEDGVVSCWGRNDFGQVGTTGRSWSADPVTLPALADRVVALAAGGYHTCALTRIGEVVCWGLNDRGQLGSASQNWSTPTVLRELGAGNTGIAAGAYHTCVLTGRGGVRCMGGNSSGELGDGTTVNGLAPVDVTGLASGVVAIAAGAYHTCAKLLAGGVRCWGLNDEGQLGDGTKQPRSVPVVVQGTP